jgi:hypothetical protein
VSGARHGVKGLGRFKISQSPGMPYIPGEDWLERHARRMQLAVENIPAIREWCEHRGVEWRWCGSDGHPHGRYFKFWVRFYRGAAVAGWLPGLGRAWMSPDSANVRTVRAKLDDYHQLLTWLEPWASLAHLRPKIHPE